MSDSKDSTVTYTAVSSPFEDGSDIGSPGVDGPPIMPEDPYAYIMAAYQPMYPEYIPQKDEILPVEEQPLPAAASPIADPPGYVPESDPEEDDEDPEEDPTDYPADRDDEDDDDEDEDEEEEEEHPALADSVPPVHCMTARISIRDEPSISLPPREEDRPEITLPPRKRLGIDLGPRYEIGESSAAAATRLIGGSVGRTDYWVCGICSITRSDRDTRAEEIGYRIRDVWVDLREAVEEVAPMTLKGVNAREALVSREAWGHSIEVSYMKRSKIMALRSVVMGSAGSDFTVAGS
ncbi:hypothetical protein Tco_1273332 [Tanacetum coccineum]